ncbi:F-box/kelch-repeat protein At3g06240-like [Chenopodium quinoa]|uniref:F-box domain-containing protein n=1 Tax=Chenopodium quinoa TaxID=63459 RepID=A0A803LL06_CHEQI|nr:F-box/kelch-repeat protein At3g06240-like [Chenopodium quinoa]
MDEDKNILMKKLRYDEINAIFETEILSHLPLNTLKNCKYVSKSWSNIIKSQYFFRLHLQKSVLQNRLNLILFNATTRIIETFEADALLPSHGTPKPYKVTLDQNFNILGSCNGLLCFGFDKIHHGSETKLIVLNPATRVWKSVRVLPVPNQVQNLKAHINSRGFGFTCDIKTMDYKFVLIVDREIHVYSLKSEAWKRIGDYSCTFPLREPQRNKCIQAKGVATDNALHWFYGSQGRIKGIFSLDLTDNKQYETPIPELYGLPKLVPLKGCLHVVFTKYVTMSGAYPANMLEIDIWRMEKYGGWEDSWVRLFKVQFDDVIFHATAVCFKEGGRKVLLELHPVDMEVLRYVWYDLVTKERVSEVLEYSAKIKAESCFESLIDPNFLKF